MLTFTLPPQVLQFKLYSTTKCFRALFTQSFEIWSGNSAKVVSTSWSIELFVLPKELTNHEVLTARAYVVMLIFMFMFMQDHNISVDYELLYLLFCKSANFIFHCFFFGKILFNFLPGS